MAEFRAMRNLMIKVRDEAKGIRHLQDKVLPDLEQQVSSRARIAGPSWSRLRRQRAKSPVGWMRFPPSSRQRVIPMYRRLRQPIARRRPSWASITGSWPNGSGRCRNASTPPRATRPGHREVSGSSYGDCRPRAGGGSHTGSPLIGTVGDRGGPPKTDPVPVL